MKKQLIILAMLLSVKVYAGKDKIAAKQKQAPGKQEVQQADR